MKTLYCMVTTDRYCLTHGQMSSHT